MTHQFTLSFPGRDKVAGTHGCETFEIEAQHPRGYYGAFCGETACIITRQSEVMRRGAKARRCPSTCGRRRPKASANG